MGVRPENKRIMTFQRIWESQPPVTRNILAVTTVVFLVDMLLRQWHIELTAWLGLYNVLYAPFSGAESFHIWQPFTYMLMHDGFSHYFFNMFAVWMFGVVIEREWGAKKYLTYYLVCGVGAALVQQLTWWASVGSYPAVTIGASGAVFGLLFAFAWLFPEQKIFLLFIPIPISARWFVAIYALVELFSGVAHFSGDNIAHFAHLGGLIFGYLLIKYWQWKDKNDDKNGRFKVYEGKDFSDYHYKDPLK